MESEQQICAQIILTQQQLSQLQKTITCLEQQSSEHQQIITDFQQQLSSIVIQDKSVQNEVLKQKISSLISNHQQLSGQIQHQSNTIQQLSSSNLKTIQNLKQEQHKLMIQISKQQIIDDGEVNQLKKALSKIAGIMEGQRNRKEQIDGYILKEEEQLRRLEQQLKQINNSLKCQKADQLNYFGQIQTQKNQLMVQLQNLQKELTTISQNYLQQTQNLKKLNQKSLQNQQTLLKEKAAQEEINISLMKNEVQLKLNLQHQNTNLKAVNDNDKQLNLSISINQKVVDQKTKDNQQINTRIQNVKKDIEMEQIRIKDEKQNGKKQNFKMLISQANKSNLNLSRQLEMKQANLRSTQDLKNKYVSRQNLQILQKQLERHKLKSSPHLEAKTAETDRLLKQNKALKDSIAKLKRLNQEASAKQEKIMKIVKAKQQNLTKQKETFDNNIKTVNNRLKEYLKEYPNHQKDVQQKKLKLKQEKTQQKKRKAEELTIKRENGLTNKKKKNQVQLELKIPTQQSRPKLYNDKYYQNNPQNLYFQLGIGALAALIIYVAWNN